MKSMSRMLATVKIMSMMDSFSISWKHHMHIHMETSFANMYSSFIDSSVKPDCNPLTASLKSSSWPSTHQGLTWGGKTFFFLVSIIHHKQIKTCILEMSAVNRMHCIYTFNWLVSWSAESATCLLGLSWNVLLRMNYKILWVTFPELGLRSLFVQDTMFIDSTGRNRYTYLLTYLQ